MPTVTVRYFANLRERRGREDETLQVDEGTTARGLYQSIFAPLGLGALPVGYAVNLEYVSGSQVLAEGDELVFIPPVGGG